MEEKKPTRFYSKLQEDSVASAIGGYTTSNSGASTFSGGDVIQKKASMLVECKTPTTKKDSVSIKKEWIDKNEEERHALRLRNQAIAITFEPNTDNYYIINERLFKFLIEKLEEENSVEC